MKKRIILVVESVLMIFATQTALATVINVVNPGFEDTPPANGWTLSGTSGTYSPNSSAYPDLAPQGSNVAYADVGTLSQGTYEFLDGDTVYALIAEVGDRVNVGFVSYAVNLYAEPSHVLLASASAPTPNSGFVTAVANYDPNGVGPDTPQVLKIELVSGGLQTNFDCVRLVKMTDPILNLTQGTRFASIQGAIYEAVDGDVIEMPPGTYHEHIDCYGKEVTLKSRSGDPNDTVIDGQFIDVSSGSAVLSSFKGSILTCRMAEDPNTVIDGFTITNGMGTYGGGYRYGGGMYNAESMPTVSKCIFSLNSVTGDGGGMHNNPAFPTVTDCIFIENHANYNGGGMDNRGGSNPTVTGCTFTDNTAGTSGGGMRNLTNSNPTVSNCSFTGNAATQWGGGMNTDNSSPTVTDCVFTANTAGNDGGGVNNSTGVSTFTRCDFEDNTASRYGGAVMNYNNPSTSFVDCTFTGNSSTTEAGAVMNWNGGNTSFNHCTFSHNSSNNGGAMFNRLNSSPVILDCIFDYNIANYNAGAIYNYEGTEYPTIAYSQFLGNRAKNDRGGAIAHRCAGTLQLDHCLFIGNDGKNYGGGCCVWAGTVEMQHCTFTANNAAVQGGGIFLESTLNMVNSIAWGNTSALGADIRRYSGTLNASYNDFGEAISGDGNLVADPNFTVVPTDGGDGWGDDPSTPAFDESTNDDFGDVRLTAGSPCIDAGNSLTTSAVDLDGFVRAVDDPDMLDIGIGSVTFLDMGAYEFGSAPPAGGLCGDLNNDGKVNMIDICMLSDNWLAGVE